MIIYFRADANSTIATGHIMRCSAIANAFLAKGHTVKFILADTEAVSIMKRFSFDYYILNTTWNNMDSEINILSQYIRSTSCDLLLVDSYYVTSNYFRKLHPITKLAYLDDLCNEAYDVDYIINYSIYAKDMSYANYYPDNTTKLLGPRYIPLRECFHKLPQHVIKKDISNILLLTGGTDNYHFALNFVKAILSHSTAFDINIVCGVFNYDLAELKNISNVHTNIHIYVNVSDMEQLMCSADIAISAGGSTTYELAVCGTPTITYSLADNQLNNVKKWESLGLMDYAGDVRENFSFTKLITMIRNLSNDYDKRKRRSALLQDGTINPTGVYDLVQSFETSMTNSTL